MLRGACTPVKAPAPPPMAKRNPPPPPLMVPAQHPVVVPQLETQVMATNAWLLERVPVPALGLSRRTAPALSPHRACLSPGSRLISSPIEPRG